MVFAQPLGYRALPPAVKALLIATGGMFLLQVLMSLSGGFSLVGAFGLIPAAVVHRFELWRLVTYLFLHGGPFHLLFNGYMLWALGSMIENQWGTRPFVKFYFLCGIGAAVFNVLFEPHSPLPVIGASGAIYGLLVAFAMMFPHAVFYVMFLIPMRAWAAVIFFAGVELLFSFSANVSGIANLAHLGGLATGFLYLKAHTWRYDLRRWRGRLNDWTVRRTERKRGVRFHELGSEVDRILEKISTHGLSSLTREEQELMERYSRMKNKP